MSTFISSVFLIAILAYLTFAMASAWVKGKSSPYYEHGMFFYFFLRLVLFLAAFPFSLLFLFSNDKK